ncbi:MAG: DUF86 domain-containing protein [Thermoplasmata archaeon]
MEEKRLSRYKEKISMIVKRRDNISSWIGERSEKSTLAVYKAYQEMMEGFTDIFAMILKDMGELVEDDYTNIERLGEKGLLDEDQEALMKEGNGLRNRLVHGYNGLERKIALESIERINSRVDEVLEGIRKWIRRQ